MRASALALGLGVVIALAPVAAGAAIGPRLPGAGPAGPGAPESCTGWTNQWQPPATIRVQRTRGLATGTVQTVPFRQYVAVVMASEWPSGYPRETLRAGAIAVKEYGWYFAMNYRGRLAPDGNCYDVTDSSSDQNYNPEKHTPHANHRSAIDATWPVSLRKINANGQSRLFVTGYRPGELVDCGVDSDGRRLFQRSSRDCGNSGMTAEQVLRIYYHPRLEFIDVRPHNIVADGAWRGDAAVLAGARGTGSAQWRLYGATANGFDAPITGRFAFELNTLIDHATGDVSGDGLADLVLLQRRGADGRRLRVLLANGSGYAAPALWREWQDVGPADDERLLVEDFDGDGLADAGVLEPEPAPSGDQVNQATLWLFRSQPATGFGARIAWWRGSYDQRLNLALAGDSTGDGRADLIVRQDRDADGLRYWVMPSLPAATGLGEPQLWLERSTWRGNRTKEVVIDQDRDGRSDLLAVRPASTGIRVDALRAQPDGVFAATKLWQAPDGSALTLDRIRPLGLHVDADGRGDLALFARQPETGLRLFWLRTTDTGMSAGAPLTDAGLPWAQARVY